MIQPHKKKLNPAYQQHDVLWFIQQHQAVFYKCSARTGCNVEDLMTHLSQYGIIFLCLPVCIVWHLHLRCRHYEDRLLRDRLI